MMLKRNDVINLDIRKFIKEWNVRYPYDRWWRKKYNIPFGSELHRKANFIEMMIEYSEDIYFQKLAKLSDESDEMEAEIDKIINSNKEGQKSTVKMTKKEVDEEFEDLDLNQFN
jgi:hypothetical protein